MLEFAIILSLMLIVSQQIDVKLDLIIGITIRPCLLDKKV